MLLYHVLLNLSIIIMQNSSEKKKVPSFWEKMLYRIIFNRKTPNFYCPCSSELRFHHFSTFYFTAVSIYLVCWTGEKQETWGGSCQAPGEADKIFLLWFVEITLNVFLNDKKWLIAAVQYAIKVTVPEGASQSQTHKHTSMHRSAPLIHVWRWFTGHSRSL